MWDVSDASGCGSLRLSWTYNGVDYDGEESDDLPGVTAVEAIKVDLKKVAVAYQNATIKIFDVVHGKELAVLHGESGSGVYLMCLSFPPHLFFFFFRRRAFPTE